MATETIRVTLPNFNALSEPQIDNYALYADDDYVLIKEKTRNTISVNGTVNIAHNLAYVPFCLVFVEVSTGVWRKLFSSPVDLSGYWFEINATNLVLINTTGSAKTFSYYIFYDNIT